jgi:hypothetical protein
LYSLLRKLTYCTACEWYLRKRKNKNKTKQTSRDSASQQSGG